MGSYQYRRLRHRISRTFVAGLVAILPLALTLALIVWLVDFIHDLLGPSSRFGRILGSIGLNFVTSDIVAYLIGAMVTVLLVYLTGALAEAGLKNKLNVLVEGTIEHVPVVRSIYSAVKRLMSAFDSETDAELRAMSTILCHLGGRGGTAVLGLMPSAQRISMNGLDYCGVLLPTAPVPFGGALLFVPAEWVEPVDISFDSLVNVYVSMGATAPDYLGSAFKRIHERARSEKSRTS
ncbi:MAG: DUF502 domain-containing protein [Gammaproteobacteria bacterium]|nr:DUF502 domain-containing protein [Gammaproteobacteria bacterium]